MDPQLLQNVSKMNPNTNPHWTALDFHQGPPSERYLFIFWTFRVFFSFFHFSFFPDHACSVFIYFYWPPSRYRVFIHFLSAAKQPVFFFILFILFIFSWQPRSARLGPGLVSKPKCKIFIYFLPSRRATVFFSFFHFFHFPTEPMFGIYLFFICRRADMRYLFIFIWPPSRRYFFIFSFFHFSGTRFGHLFLRWGGACYNGTHYHAAGFFVTPPPELTPLSSEPGIWEPANWS